MVNATDRPPQLLNKAVVASGLLAAFLFACDGGDGTFSDSVLVEELADRLVLENAQHYAFGCMDSDGSVLSADYAPDAIALDAEIEHAAVSWAAETSGVVLGGDDGQQYLVIHDPASGATNAKEFEEREVAANGGKLLCLVPE